MNRTILSLAAILTFPAWISSAAEVPPGASLVKTIEWKAEKLPESGKLDTGGPEGRSYVSIENGKKEPTSIPLWETKEPGIQTKCYAVRGKIRYRGVEGVGYLDLWSSFSGTAPQEPKAKYFSRTLADRGPLQRITGSSDWRDVVLPFDGTQSKTLPAGLELNLVLAGPGSVDVTDLQVLQFADAASMWAALGGAVSGKVGMWVSRWLFGSVLVVGIVILAGVVMAIVRKKRQHELRRMRAMDLR